MRDRALFFHLSSPVDIRRTACWEGTRYGGSFVWLADNGTEVHKYGNKQARGKQLMCFCR
jgi:hypothetical protein